MEIQQLPLKDKREDKEKGADEPKQDVKTEEEADQGHYCNLLSPCEEVYAEANPSAKPQPELPGRARPYCVISCLSVICVILLMAVVILGVKLGTKSTVYFEEENPGNNTEGPMVSVEKLCLEHFKKTCDGIEHCPYKWFTFGNYCFFLSTFMLSWEQSQSECISIGGSLAVINSQDVQNFLTEKGNLMYWIGLKKHQSAWKWVNNKEVEKCYWATNEDTGHCALLNSHNPPQGNWIQFLCQSPSYFICQLEY